MSEPTEKENPSEPFSALSFKAPHDPGTLSLSDSDPDLSDDAEVVASVSAEEEEDDEQDSREIVGYEHVQPFSLKGTNFGFSQRSSNIFGGLLDVQSSSLLCQQSRNKKEVVSTSPAAEPPNPDLPGQKESETLNTRRSVLPNKKRSASARLLPDYLTHPERWTKYSLEDVPDTSERTNRNTALNFLTELKHQKATKESSSDSASLSYNQGSSSSAEGRILFKKPQKKCQKGDEKSEAQSGQSHIAASWGNDGGEDTEVLAEPAETENSGFHGIKKRSRKNIRPKAEDKDDNNDS
ncbi:U5 small nuclear ribonucleoprotein TSSC4 [Gastrophryne carolinensis]